MHTLTISPTYELLSRVEAAEYLRLDITTISRMITAGRLPTVRLGCRVLLRREALAAYLHPAHPVTHTPAPDPEAIITRPEAIRVLKISPSHFDSLAKEHGLTPLYAGRSVRFRLAEVLAFIDACSTPATIGPLAGRVR